MMTMMNDDKNHNRFIFYLQTFIRVVDLQDEQYTEKTRKTKKMMTSDQGYNGLTVIYYIQGPSEVSY